MLIYWSWVFFRVAMVSWGTQRSLNYRSAWGCSDRDHHSGRLSVLTSCLELADRSVAPAEPLPATGCRWQESQLVWATGKQGSSASMVPDSWDRPLLYGLVTFRVQRCPQEDGRLFPKPAQSFRVPGESACSLSWTPAELRCWQHVNAELAAETERCNPRVSSPNR